MYALYNIDLTASSFNVKYDQTFCELLETSLHLVNPHSLAVTGFAKAFAVSRNDLRS